MKQRIDLESFDLIFLIFKNEKTAFQNHLEIPTMSSCLNDRNKDLILIEPCQVMFFMDPSYTPV